MDVSKLITAIWLKMIILTLNEILGKQKSFSSNNSSALQYMDRMTNMTKEVRIIANAEKVAVCQCFILI